MEVTKVPLDRVRARELFIKYKAHRVHQKPIDQAIQRVYQEIARGRSIICARASIIAAGLDATQRPRLAIARADFKRVYFDGRSRFAPSTWIRSNAARGSVIDLGRQAFGEQSVRSGWAQVPLIPVHLRPRRGLPNYHILFEADWTAPPIDPILLRFLSGDAWLVVAAWDLTEVERACMAHTLGSRP